MLATRCCEPIGFLLSDDISVSLRLPIVVPAVEKRSTPKDAVRPAVPSTTERSLREFSSPQRAFFLRFRPKLPVKAEKTPRFLKKTPRYLEHIPKVRTFASQLRTRALSSAGSERLPYKQRVGGSNPSAPTSPVRRLHLF